MDFVSEAVLARAYYAGLFDGEGSVGIYRISAHRNDSMKNHTRLVAKVTNTYHPALLPLMDKFGGSIENNRASEKYPEWQDTYSWKVTSDRAISFLNWIYPHSIIKREQIDVVKEFWEYWSPLRYNRSTEFKPDQQMINSFIERLKQLKRGK